MGKLIDLDLLAKEYVGKVFTFLTVLDVVRVQHGSKSCVCFMCKCKCGKEVYKPYRKVTSGHTKSCGCYKKSPEMSKKISDWHKDNPEAVAEKGRRHSAYLRNHPEVTKTAALKHSEWYKNNPDKTKELGERHAKFYKDNPEVGKNAGKKISQWYKDNPEKVKEKAAAFSNYCKSNHSMMAVRRIKYMQWCKENPDKLKERGFKSSLWHNDIHKHIASINKIQSACRQKRIANTSYEVLKDIVPNDTYDKLCSGEYDSHSVISVKCPVCGNYAPHILKNFYNLSCSKLKFGRVPVCKLCKNRLSSSKYENEIADYISTFYNGELVRNSREIIPPLELDLYYPDKQIAVEFNGDYWHSVEFKDKSYHYNKFSLCRDKDILLISVFEKYWVSDKDSILKYIMDTFNGLDNELSFDGYRMNNNYPSLSEYSSSISYIDDHYFVGKVAVYTCGYSIRPSCYIEEFKFVDDSLSS